MLRAVNFVSTSVRLKRYDFIKSYNAVDVNYERIGFRKVNGKYIDASTVVNASTLSAIQQHYALARPPPPDDLRLFLSAGDLSDLRQLIGNNIDAFSNIDKHAFLIGVGQKFGQNALQLPEFSSTLVHALQSHQNAKELVELTDLSTRVLGFDYTSPVASRLLESVAYHINDISLLDTVKLSISLNPDSHVFGALTYRTQQLIDALLFNESGSNKELLKKFEGWSLIDFCLLTLTLQSRQSIEVIEDLLPYVLYEQVLQKHVSTGFGKTFFINIDCSLFSESKIFSETVMTRRLTGHLLYTAILSSEIFGGENFYQKILDDDFELAESLNEVYDIISKKSLKNIGSVYAFLRGEDIDSLYRSLYATTTTLPEIQFLDS